ncbi:hypothetical protein F4677DRAFT_40808 [Hypoxylon crocopeplum]|nr:hypothetical protein F4677DRAFT_40808 [Hypoxylon crocopeplum]
MSTIWRRACEGCTKSKRQCTKGVPACRRCADKGVPCVYPPPRRNNNHVLLQADLAAAAASSSSSSSVADASSASAIPPTLTPSSGNDAETVSAVPVIEEPPPPPPPLPQPSFDGDDDTTTTGDGMWFLEPESWVADHTPPAQPEAESMMQRFVDSVQKWHRQWVTRGSSPLHHRYLYRAKMPRCVEDAYTAVAMYEKAAASDGTSTPETRATAARVLDDRVTQLLQDQALDGSLRRGADMDVFDHICRVQAMLTYQAIRLFDGDVRMRAQAEALIPTLALWIRQLLESSKASLAQPLRFLAAFAGPESSDNGFSEDAVWRAWILIESARRTWLVANYVQEIYLYMKRGWGECPGRVVITMRAGLWDAASSYAWSRACRERGALFLPTRQTELLFRETCPSDIDELSLLVVELSYGGDRIERWFGDARTRGQETPSLLERWDGELISAVSARRLFD